MKCHGEDTKALKVRKFPYSECKNENYFIIHIRVSHFYTFFELSLATFFSDDPTHSEYPDFFSEFFEHRYIPSLGLKDSSDLRK